MRSRTRFIVLITSAPIIAFAVIGGFLGRAVARDDTYQHLRVFEDVVSLIVNNYVEEVDVDKVMTGAMSGLADALDADSAYLSAEDVRSLERGEEPGQADVGLYLTRQYYLRAVAARDSSPAAKAGLRSGDYVRAIDGKPTRDISAFEGQRLLRGAPGSKVKVTVIRGSAADPRDIELVREILSVPNVSGRLLTGSVGYVRIAEFGKSVTAEVQAKVGDLRREGASGLVVDVRGTAGGDIERGVEVARLFVPSGTLASRESRGSERETFMAGSGDGAIVMPATVLVDTGSSGAAEVFAAALGGNHRAELIGEKTSGRAASQKLVKLPDGSGLWISATRFLMPNGESLHEKGVQPDIEVEQPDLDFGADAPTVDATLEKALERLSMKKAA